MIGVQVFRPTNKVIMTRPAPSDALMDFKYAPLHARGAEKSSRNSEKKCYLNFPLCGAGVRAAAGRDQPGLSAAWLMNS